MPFSFGVPTALLSLFSQVSSGGWLAMVGVTLLHWTTSKPSNQMHGRETIEPDMTETPADDIQPAEPKRRFSWLLVPAIIFAAMATMFMFALQSGDPSKLPSALLGKPVPEFELPALPGLEGVPGFGSEDLGKADVTVVNFWASWCGPCREEHPVLEVLKRDGAAKMFGINYKDPAPGGRRFLGQYGNPFSLVGVDSTGRVAIDWGVYGMPETFVVDGKGRIVYKHVGPMTMKDLDQKIRPAIAAAKAAATRRQ